MRNIPAALALLAVLAAPDALAVNRAVEIHINGIGPAVDAAAYKTVRQVVGFAVGSGLIDTFLVRGYAKEGGISACAEAAPGNTSAAGLSAFVQQLRAIKPNPKTTAYSVNLAASCAPENTVLCPADVKACPDGSYVSRQPPSCAFAACPAK
jgi:hypothetical protein